MSKKLDQHELVSLIKSASLELGRVPTRDDFLKHTGVFRSSIDEAFGSYSVLVQAAGLKSNRAPKIDNSIFEVDIERHLDLHHEQKSTETISAKKSYPTIAIMGDLHEPFSDPRVKAEFIEFVRIHKPEYVVQVGDAFDAYAHSKFPRSHNIYTPKQEEDLARKNLEEFWANVKSASPLSKCVMLCGNHCLRPIKRVLEAVPSIEHWAEKYFQELMTFQGVHTQIDPREEYVIGDIAFLHGYRSRLGEHRDHMLMNAVVGHTHLGGVSFRQIHGKVLWELNAGFAGNVESKALSYTSQKMSKSTLGFGYINEYGPMFIHV